MTRLQIFFPQHQTTDDSTSNDYDYSVEEDEDTTQYELPLISIIHDNDKSEKPQHNFTDESFRDRNDTQDIEVVSSTVAAVIATTMKETEISTEKTITDENATRVNESDINSDQNDTTTVDESVMDTTPVFSHFDDQFDDENNYTTTTTSDEFVINESEKAQAEKAISSDSVGNYFDAMLVNDSLLIDNFYHNDGLVFENTTDSEFDSTTVDDFTELSTENEQFEELSSGDKALGDLLNDDKASLGLLSPDRTSVELLNKEKDLSVLSNSEKASTELLNSDKLSIPFNEKSFTHFVTVEKTSSRPSIVNGPFLIFGEPFSKHSSAEKNSQELSGVEKVFPESSSKASEDFKPTTQDNFEYSTVNSIKTSTVDTFKPTSSNNFYYSSINAPELVTFNNQQSSKVQNQTETLSETSKEDFNLPITTLPPRTSQIQPVFTPNLFPYENRIIKDDQQIREMENVEENNKFVYHHLPSTDVSSTPSVVRFPIYSQQRVRFPDEPKNTPATFSWPRDNGGLMRFWQDQPLINDFKIFSRGNSRSSNGNFHRRNYR